MIAENQDQETLELLKEGKIDMITFASSSTVTNLLAVLKRMGVEDPVALLNDVTIACIGPVTAETAFNSGLHVNIQPEDSTLDALVEAMAAYRLAARMNNKEAHIQ